MVAVLIVFALVACGEDAEQRRFATDKQPTFAAASPTARATSTSPPSPTVPPRVVSPEALVRTSGAPDTVYLAWDNAIWAVNIAERGSSRVVSALPETQPVFAASPDGKYIAILADMPDDAEGVALVVFEGGTVRYRIDGIEQTFTDVGPELVPVSLDWSSDGNRILAGFLGGGLLDIPLDGEPSVLLGVKQLPWLVSARWSPQGDVVAYIAREGADGAGRLFVAKLRGGATDPVLLAPKRGATGQSVEALSWRPDAGTILYLQSSIGSTVEGQDLFEISPVGEERRLIASAGRVAPVAGIVEFAVSPDGNAVAYSVHVPAPDGARFDSLWIGSIDAATAIEVPLQRDVTVTEFRWSVSGLVIETINAPESDATPEAEIDLYLFGTGLTVVPVLRPDATPDSQSSPVPGTPVA